ncbi:FAD-dependent oxidoreductase [Deltaproteobacteria bacterium]|nr:FAD-dependent oxidoreductase [Deltaproteobacteria bacterium]
MKQLEADLVVVAGGTSGLAAAVAAAQAGADVIVFEKASTTGGAGNMAFGPFAAESRLQRLKQIKFSREDAFKIQMDYTHWRVDAQLVKAFIDKSADTIDWLEKMGVEFLEVGCHNPGFPFTWHIVKAVGVDEDRPGLAGAAMKILTETAKELGVKFYFRTPVKKLVKKGRQIEGVIAEDETGEDIRANAKAVVIATGGFGDNPAMIKKYTGFEWGRNLHSVRIPGVTGDGIRMAWDVGAAPTEMIMHLTPLRVPELEDFANETFLFRQASLIVNEDGERFMNEQTQDNPTFVGNAVASQKNGCAYILFDEDIVKHYEEEGPDIPLDGVGAVLNPDVTTISMRPVLDKGYENIFAADSLEELADKTGINKENLLKTVEVYNEACDTGRDERFHKQAKFLQPIRKPQFIAGRLFPGAIGTLGGIKTNYRLEALDKKFEVIPGLYAAGYDANSTHGDSYAFVLPGGTLGFALNSGRMAGENAAEYIKSIKG